MICDALEHLNRYRGLHRNLDTAIDYLTAYHVAHDLYDRQHPPRIPQKVR